jgi:methylated-DNA-[protein]-cysteine S-methyltransferase
MPNHRWMDSPVGKVLLTASDRAITGLYLENQKYFPKLAEPAEEEARWSKTDRRSSPLLDLAQTQLAEYFALQRQQFDLPIAPEGTAFQQQVWQLLQQIPFGETISYGTLAQWYGQPQASRAVGAANGRNPISIIVPCHRVVASTGKLTGYAGGLDRKQWLLTHEQTTTQGQLNF